jgi:hypothetical protein
LADSRDCKKRSHAFGYSRPPMIEDDGGFMVTMKQTVGQGVGWFMWGFKKLRRKKAVAKA